MAHLEVKPKAPYPVWIWALLLVVLIVVITVVFSIYIDGDIPSAPK